MVPDMVALVCEYHQVLGHVVQAVPVDMVDDMIRLQVEELRHLGPAQALTVPGLDIGATLAGLEKREVADLGAEQVFGSAHPAPVPGHGLAAGEARYLDLPVGAGIDAGTLEHLVDSLPGHTVPDGYILDALKPDGHAVNYVGDSRLIGHLGHGLASWLGLMGKTSLHYGRIVVKDKDGHNVTYRTQDK
jgi:hypothetical protein